MNIIQKYRSDINSILLLLGIFLLARILFVIFMPPTFSKDLYFWLESIDIVNKGGEPDSSNGLLNWSLFWMPVLYGIRFISKITSVSDTRLIQIVLVIGEAMVMLLSYWILRRFLNQQRPVKVLIIALALNPISILLNCQHCNFDVFVAFWVLLFVGALLHFYETQSSESWLIACFFLGMGIFTKTVPVMLSPILLVGIKKLNPVTVFFGFVLLFMPVIEGMSILISWAHTNIKTGLNYRSVPCWYGITGFLGLMNIKL